MPPSDYKVALDSAVLAGPVWWRVWTKIKNWRRRDTVEGYQVTEVDGKKV